MLILTLDESLDLILRGIKNIEIVEDFILRSREDRILSEDRKYIYRPVILVFYFDPLVSDYLLNPWVFLNFLLWFKFPLDPDIRIH